MGCFRNMLTAEDTDHIIAMAWENRTPFEAIEYQFGLSEQEVIDLMRKNLKPYSWRLWRKRVHGRKTKFQKLRSNEVSRFKSDRQRNISLNKVSKR